MRRIIRTAEPPRPSNRLGRLTAEEITELSARRHASVPELTGAVRGDLDWIVMKCREKDRMRRYDTASNLAADVQHHLDHEPIAARPPARLYRFRKFVQRNKGAFAALTAITLVLCAGVVVSVNQALRARRGEASANAALAELRDIAPLHAAEARELAMAGEYALAMEKLDRAISLNPTDPGYLLAKADLLECELRFPEAIAVYRSLLERDPSHAQAQRRLAFSTQLAGTARDAQWHETLSRLYVEMTAGRDRSQMEIYAVAIRVKEHCVEKLRAREPQGAVFAGRLQLSSSGELALDLRGTAITDLGPLQGLPVKSLIADGCAISGLTPLRGMPLRLLSLNITKVEDLEPLRGMSTLRDLSIAGTAVSDLSPLHGLPGLKWISLAGSPVKDLTPLQGLSLRVLRIGGTRVENLAPLAGLPLDELNCIGIPADDFAPLAAFTTLRHLDLSGTTVKDLEVFRGGSLWTLNLSGTVV